MNRIRFALTTASALAIFAGGALLSTPAPVQASELFACSGTQIEYVRGAIRAECNCGGSTTASCDGYDISVGEINCYAC